MSRTEKRYPYLAAAATAMLIAAVPGTATAPDSAGPTPTQTVAATTADLVPDADTGWLPTDFVKHPLNPVHTFGVDNDTQRVADRIFPVVVRVDDKLAAPLDGHRWYLYTWRHGLDPRTPTNGGRLHLLTGDSLEGPWTDRGFVTDADITPEGWRRYGWTGGDVVWSERHDKFFSVPHAFRNADNTAYPPPRGHDSFLMESVDGVEWTVSDVPQPVLVAGPEVYDALQTGYGRLLRIDGPGGSERWVWLYRSHRTPDDYTTFSVATAGDIYGPWEKAADNPVFDPTGGGSFGPGGALIGINGLVCYQGYYQILWQGFLGPQSLARSTDLRDWESFAPLGAGDTTPFGRNNSVPIIVGGAHDVVITGGDLVYDDTVGAWTFVYTAWDAQNLAAGSTGEPGTVSINIARSLSGGAPPHQPASDHPTRIAGACDG